MYVNPFYVPIQRLKSDFYDKLEKTESLEEMAQDPDAISLEMALSHSDNTSFKLIHPLFLKGYKMPSARFAAHPMKYVGLDVETQYQTGEPRLIGIYYPEQEIYQNIEPTLDGLFSLIESLNDNGIPQNIVTWGNLDIQVLLRLFNPSEEERKAISRGISGNIVRGQIVGSPPILRLMRGKEEIPFYVSHYMSGRSAKLGYIARGREFTSWIFNLSQFYPGTIPQTAKGLGLPWTDFDKATHLIDWARFAYDRWYRGVVLESNKQDAITVAKLADVLQERFFKTFESYPRILVSAGSLTDAAVSKMLKDGEGPEDYASNSWAWLRYHVFDESQELVAKMDTLLSEAFSAGYVDQFAIGYFPEVCTADISSAYPHKIRTLPDLRKAVLYAPASLDVEIDCKWIEEHERQYVETALIRGVVTIPESLVFHPITLKTYNRENYRPHGSFRAAYTLDERRYCQRYGATFSEEEYVIVALTERLTAPIGSVSSQLGEMRSQLAGEMKLLEQERGPDTVSVTNISGKTVHVLAANVDRYRMLDGQQYTVKIVDNSIYGKTVMTTEVVENLDNGDGTESPHVTGYVAGDRFNLLYGTLITARTRIQLAEAAMAILKAGGKPIMCMTDSLYWEGTPDMLPEDSWRPSKIAGYFEAPVILHDFYLIKTGQYEYRHGLMDWQYKLRGLNADRELLTGTGSFFRHLISEHCKNLRSFTHPKDISIPVETRRLITIGSMELESLGKVQDGITKIAPFVLSSKQKERYLRNWKEAINGHIWLGTPDVESADRAPGEYLRNRYEQMQETSAEDRAIRLVESKARRNRTQRLKKRTFIMLATLMRDMEPPEHWQDQSWKDLEEWYGITWDGLASYFEEWKKK